MGLGDLFRRPTDKEKFAKVVEKHLRAKGWAKPIAYDRAKNALLLGDGQPVMFLDNLFQDWSKAPAGTRGSEIDKAAAWLLRPRPSRDYDAVREKLLPAVRNRAHIEGLWLDDRVRFGREAWQGAYEALCEDLAVIAVIDLPEAMTLVDGKLLQEWNRPLRSVLDQAIENLRARSPVIFAKHEAGFFISGYGDYHDAARLMLPDIFERLPVRGAPVAIPVERSGLVVAGEDDTAALLAMAEFAEAHLTKATRPTAYLPLVLRERRWQRFVPAEPALAPLRLLAVKQRLWDYGEQKAMMERHFERSGRDVFVATLNSILIDGVGHTYAQWSRGVVTLLPRADTILLYRDDPRQFLPRRWEAVVAVCGDLLTPEAFYPPRFLVTTGPSDAQLTQLATEFAAPSGFPELGQKT